ncbi:hypothetical protein BT69DRAFT_943768 [Atractiella rhizophila]|nr:hypothetical protein BT69DRAFT_943768 [Atractiella rhizophila]
MSLPLERKSSGNISDIVRSPLLPLSNVALCALTFRRSRLSPQTKGYMPVGQLKVFSALWTASSVALALGYQDAGLASNLAVSSAWLFESLPLLRHAAMISGGGQQEDND